MSKGWNEWFAINQTVILNIINTTIIIIIIFFLILIVIITIVKIIKT